MNLREINLLDLFYYVVKRIWLVIACVALAVIITLVTCKFIVSPEYTASARVYVLSRSSDTALAYSDLQSSEQLTSDFKVLVAGKNITSAVIETLKLDVSDSELAEEISVSNPDGTRILQINVTDKEPERAAQIVNCILDIATEQIVPIMGIESLNVIYEATAPTVPSAPNIGHNCLIAALVSGLIAIALILLRFAADDAIKTEDDVERYLGLSTMGIIPKNITARKQNAKKKQ